ncbi:MAG: hypothetical protein IIC67_00135 [Thaumarchaeota archaeon]|nr:hypothetical protein [Nitrososphaerota archaeon]
MKSSDNVSFVKATNEEMEYRLSILTKVLEEGKNRNDIINENYLLYHMNLKGIQNYNRSKLYHDRLTLDSQNSYITNFIPKYSKYQEDINAELDTIREETIELSRMKVTITKTQTRETKDGTFVTETVETGSHKLKLELLKIRAKVTELKQKHAEGNNINISAAIIQREMIKTKNEIKKLRDENRVLKETVDD